MRREEAKTDLWVWGLVLQTKLVVPDLCLSILVPRPPVACWYPTHGGPGPIFDEGPNSVPIGGPDPPSAGGL